MERVLEAAEAGVYESINKRTAAIERELPKLQDRQSEIQEELAAVGNSTKTLVEHTGLGIPEEIEVPGTETDEYQRLVHQSHNVRNKRIALEGEQQRLTNIPKEQAAFAERLSEAGIPHMSILPEEVWYDLLKKLGIFRFERWEDGTVPAQEEWTEKTSALIGTGITATVIFAVVFLITGSAVNGSLLAGATLCGGLGIITGAAFSQQLEAGEDFSDSTAFGVAWGIILSGFFLAAGFGTVAGTTFKQISPVEGLFLGFSAGIAGFLAAIFVATATSRLSSWAAYILPRGMLLRGLWPQYHDAGDIRISVRFPKAPDDFRALRDKVLADNFDAGIAAEPDAISVDRAEIADALKKRAQERRERMQRSLAGDPILYVKQDGLVAVIGQYGTFPAEELAVETARRVGIEWALN